MRLKLKIRNICHWYSAGVVAFIVVYGWGIVAINSHPIQVSHISITKNHPINKLQTPSLPSSSHQNNIQSNHPTQSSSMKTTITNQPSTIHFIKYENVIYKLKLSTDGKETRWIYVTPLYNHHHDNVEKGNDVSGHTRRPTGNKRTVMKVSNATIPITLSTVHHTNNTYNSYENFNHNNHKVNNINNDNDADYDDDTVDRNVLTKFLNLEQNSVQSGNEKLNAAKLSNIEKLKRATVERNFKQSNNGITNESNDEFNNIDEHRENVEKENLFENERSFYYIRNGFNPFGKKMFDNDGVVKNLVPPLIKKNFVKTVSPDNGLSSHQRYAAIHSVTSQSSVPFRHQQLNKFSQNDYYRLMEERHRKYFFLQSNPLNRGNEFDNKYGIWVNHRKPLDPAILQLMLTHNESILPQPQFWGIRGYGLYSFAAGNDLHNNLPNGGYKVERDFDN